MNVQVSEDSDIERPTSNEGKSETCHIHPISHNCFLYKARAVVKELFGMPVKASKSDLTARDKTC